MKRVVPCLLFVCTACGDAADGAEGSGGSTTVDASTGVATTSGPGGSSGPSDGSGEETTGTADLPAPPVEIELIQIDTGAFVFDARAAGPADGDLVLLLHGFPETSYEWTEQLPALGAAGYRAVAPNQRGYSATARPPEIADYEAELLVGDVLAMADALGADDFHVAGHDWGAVIAWGLAATAPDRLRTMTSVSIPHPDAFAEQLADMDSCQYAASAYFDFFITEGSEDILLANDAVALRNVWGDLPPEAIDDYLDVLGTPEALGAALNWYRANIADRTFIPPPLGPISVPTLYIWSDMDEAVCQEGADATENFVTGPYEFVVIEGVSHWVPELAAAEVTEHLLAHLADG